MELYHLHIVSLVAGFVFLLLSIYREYYTGILLPQPSFGPMGLRIPYQLLIELGLVEGKTKFKLRSNTLLLAVGIFLLAFAILNNDAFGIKDKTIRRFIDFFEIVLIIVGLISGFTQLRTNEWRLFGRKPRDDSQVTEEILASLNEANVQITSFIDLSDNFHLFAHKLPYAYSDDFLTIPFEEIKDDKTLSVKAINRMVAFHNRGIDPDDKMGGPTF